MAILILLLAAVLTAVTVLPLWRTHLWWIRMWDFPRVQIAIAQAAVLGLALGFLDGWVRWAVAAALLAGIALHLRRIHPFTPLSRREMHFAPSRDDGREITVLAANVLMENDRHDLVRELIRRIDPDVLLLMEIDDAWHHGVREALEGYETVIAHPKDNYYGLIFATRLERVDAKVVYLTPDDTPAVLAELRTPSGQPFHYVGLHPQPPVPGVDTHDRDMEILYAARFARKTDVPLVTMGDFNDAAWSHTSRLFKHYGRYLDPRRGRGLYASFHAKNPLIRCAIDQLFVTDDIAVVDFSLGPKIGSDHFPVVARIRIDPDEARRLNVRPKAMTDEEHAEIEERIADYRSRVYQPKDDQAAS